MKGLLIFNIIELDVVDIFSKPFIETGHVQLFTFIGVNEVFLKGGIV